MAGTQKTNESELIFMSSNEQRQTMWIKSNFHCLATMHIVEGEIGMDQGLFSGLPRLWQWRSQQLQLP